MVLEAPLAARALILKGTDQRAPEKIRRERAGSRPIRGSGKIRKGPGGGEMAETEICRDVVTERPKWCSLPTGVSHRGFPRAGTADASKAGPTSGHADVCSNPSTPGLTATPWATSHPHLYTRDRAVRKPLREITQSSVHNVWHSGVRHRYLYQTHRCVSSLECEHVLQVPS